MPQVIVWSKPRCVQCNGVKRWLDLRGYAYEERQLLDDLDKLNEFKDKGLMQAPIVEIEGEEPFSGYQPDRLKAAFELEE